MANEFALQPEISPWTLPSLVNFNDLLGSERHTHFTFSIREVPPLIASPAEAKSFLLLSVVVFPLLIRAM